MSYAELRHWRRYKSMKSIHERLSALEERMKVDPLIVLLADGTTCTARECVANGWGWCRVVGGSDLKDLELLLNTIREKAEREQI